MTRLNDILAAFASNESISLSQLSKKLEIEPGVLKGMLQFWIRKGKIREICCEESTCTGCGSHSSCIILTLPHRYELVETTK
jgi:hypothetical protein